MALAESHQPLHQKNTIPYDLFKWLRDSGYKLKAGQVCTHTVMSGGSYAVPDDQHAEFLRRYVVELDQGKNLYFVERLGTAFKFLVDADIMDTKAWSSVDVLALVEDIQSFLVEIVDKQCLTVLVCTSPPRPKGDRVKSGVHLVWPHLIVQAPRAYLLLSFLVQSLARKRPHQPWHEWLDPAVFNGTLSKTGLRMLGSFKCEACPLCKGRGYTDPPVANDIDECSCLPYDQPDIASYIEQVRDGKKPKKPNVTFRVKLTASQYSVLTLLDAAGRRQPVPDDRMWLHTQRSVRVHDMPVTPVAALPAWYIAPTTLNGFLRIMDASGSAAVGAGTGTGAGAGTGPSMGTGTPILITSATDELSQRVQRELRTNLMFQRCVVNRITVVRSNEGRYRGLVSTGASVKYCPVAQREHRSNHLSFIMLFDPAQDSVPVIRPYCNDIDCKMLNKNMPRFLTNEMIKKLFTGAIVGTTFLPERAEKTARTTSKFSAASASASASTSTASAAASASASNSASASASASTPDGDTEFKITLKRPHKSITTLYDL